MLEAISFLRALERHNDREWFARHKEQYQAAVLLPMRRLVAALDAACARRGIPLYGDERRSIFRVYRDIRFSPDKRPFKTYAAAYLSRDGERTTQGGLYIRISPEGSWVSVAFFQPPPPLLQRWRRALAGEPKRFARVVAALQAKRLRIRPPEDWDDALRRMPRGFESFAASPLAPYFRLRSFAVRRTLTQRELAGSRLSATVMTFIEAAGPLLRYGWQLENEDA
ncbi:MAG TPA: DUF2461 domain-containing protein [Candidatus Binatia bacterium]|nr:DUF2461 domain-containing protein [Candidatus Binatia bacterium]